LAAAAVFARDLEFRHADDRGATVNAEDVARQVVAGHIRVKLATQPFDIASSDRHTVKPWFTSRLPESPQVPDLAAQGFVLVVPCWMSLAMIRWQRSFYKHAAHTVSLTTLPAGQSVSDQTIAGYNVRSWSDASSPTLPFRTYPARILQHSSAHFPGDRRRRKSNRRAGRPGAPPGRANPQWAVWQTHRSC